VIRGEETVATTVGAVSLSLDPVIGDWLVTVCVAIVAALATWGSTKIQHRTKPEHALIDQLQEDLQGVRTRMDRLERRERIRDDYIAKLRRHIEDGNPPPPPPWPEALLNKED
jgi:hypothetical protein